MHFHFCSCSEHVFIFISIVPWVCWSMKHQENPRCTVPTPFQLLVLSSSLKPKDIKSVKSIRKVGGPGVWIVWIVLALEIFFIPWPYLTSSYGYRGRDCRSNLYLLPTGETVYFIASVVVLFNVDEQLQRHYTGHTDDIKWWETPGDYYGDYKMHTPTRGGRSSTFHLFSM